MCTSMCKIDPDPDPVMSKTVETYLIVQGAQVGALWRPNWDWGRDRGKSKREGIYVYVKLIHFIVQQELTQHGKATLTQLIKKKKKFALDQLFHVVGRVRVGLFIDTVAIVFKTRHIFWKP